MICSSTAGTSQPTTTMSSLGLFLAPLQGRRSWRPSRIRRPCWSAPRASQSLLRSMLYGPRWASCPSQPSCGSAARSPERTAPRQGGGGPCSVPASSTSRTTRAASCQTPWRQWCPARPSRSGSSPGARLLSSLSWPLQRWCCGATCSSSPALSGFRCWRQGGCRSPRASSGARWRWPSASRRRCPSTRSSGAAGFGPRERSYGSTPSSTGAQSGASCPSTGTGPPHSRGRSSEVRRSSLWAPSSMPRPGLRQSWRPRSSACTPSCPTRSFASCFQLCPSSTSLRRRAWRSSSCMPSRSPRTAGNGRRCWRGSLSGRAQSLWSGASSPPSSCSVQATSTTREASPSSGSTPSPRARWALSTSGCRQP
mmetsp:Transcript_1899/g.4492  ORF Transcript_1899/g.4492 Transcript_1899/m.4492 type:complete len:367 (-) Transcript_1899:717-1817(-)